MNKLIELWKINCGNCRAVKPIVKELEDEGFVIEKFDIHTEEGKKMWDDYAKEIDQNSEDKGYEQGYIYTPTFINPITRDALSLANNHPTKAQLIELAEET